MKITKIKLYFIISFFLFLFFSQIFLFIENNAKNIDDVQLTTLTHREKYNKIQNYSKILAGEKLSLEFYSKENNLGIISFLFNNYEKKNTDVLIFRIKEKGTSEWYFEKEYSTSKMDSSYYYTLGFPIIFDSKNKNYVLELESKLGTEQNSISLHTGSSFFMSKYSYPKSYLTSNPDKLFSFIFKRIDIYINYIDMEAIGVILIKSVIVLIFITIFYFIMMKLFGNLIKKNIMDLIHRKKDLFEYAKSYIESSNFLLEFLLFISPGFLILNFAFFSPIFESFQPNLFLLIFLIFSNIGYFFLFFKVFIKFNIGIFKHLDYLLLFPVGIYIFLRSFFIDAVPRWDSAVYYHALLKSMNEFDFTINSFLGFNWYKHPSMGFGLISSLFQFLTPYNIYMLNFGSLILGVLGIVSFYYLALYLFGTKRKKEILFLTTLFSINPLFFGVSTAYLPDFGVIVFFLAAIASFFYKKHILSFLFFLLLIFSKETGAYVYSLFILFYGLFIILKQIKTIKIDKLYNFIINIIPGIIYFFYLIYTRGAHWTAGKPIVVSSDCFFCFSFRPEHFVQNWYVMFFLNFTWILSIFILIFIFKNFIIRNKKFKVIRDVKISELKSLIFTFLGFIAFFMVFVIYVIPSYMTISIAFMLLIFYYALINLIKNDNQRIIIMSIIAIIFFVQNLRNFDILSQKIFGSFTLGNHEVIKVASEYSCDGLIYNTEYVYMDRLINKFHKDFKISKDDNIIIAASYWHSFYLGGGGYQLYIDSNSLNKTFDKNNGFLPGIYILKTTKKFPNKAYYLKFPWLENADENLKNIKLIYTVEQKNEIENNGYKLIVYTLIKK